MKMYEVMCAWPNGPRSTNSLLDRHLLWLRHHQPVLKRKINENFRDTFLRLNRKRVYLRSSLLRLSRNL